ncbi:bursicon-like [Antedon mediterranea]
MVDSRILFILVIQILSVYSGRSNVGCSRQQIRLSISMADCRPRNVYPFGCRGQCASYTRVSPANFLEIDRQCKCCQVGEQVDLQVRLDCPKLKPPVGMVTVKSAKNCSCRPCNSVEVQSIEPFA